jgi:hypothetical protein
MSVFSAEQREKLRESTRGAAAAFLEDMEYLREVTARIETSRGELRRLSSVLRRLLIDGAGDIPSIAAPRIGRVKLQAPDNKPFYDAQKRLWYPFFASRGAKIFGVRFEAIAFANAGKADPLRFETQAAEATAFAKDYDPDRRIELRIDNFLAQPVLCYFRKWITRKATIKYIANVASGVHSGEAATEEEKLIERVRQACSYNIRNGKVEVHVLPELGLDSANIEIAPDKEINFTAAEIDPVLVEVLAAAQLLTISPDVSKLEEIVRIEG